MSKPWSDEETKYLIELYYHHYQGNEKEKINCNQITKSINERFSNDRSPQAIKVKAHRLKISKKYATRTNDDYDDDDDNNNDYYDDGIDNNEDSQKLGKINFDDGNVKVKEEIKDQQPVKTTTISISILGDNNNNNSSNNNNENSVQTITTTTTTTKIPEIDTPPITNATTTTTTKNLKKLKKDLIEVEINYLKKRLDYLTEKLNNLEI
ncbi:hypothetical protein ACTFIW_006872 [Dictyostelium discoideum]